MAQIETEFFKYNVIIFKTDYSQYAIFTEREEDADRYYSLAEAKIEAANWGGYLAEFTTVEELDAFYAYIKPEIDYMQGDEGGRQQLAMSSEKTLDGGGAAYGWIGASDADAEGVWKWETSNTSLSTSDFGGWATNAPNDLNFDQDQAAFAFTSFSESGADGSSGNAGKINDVSASNQSLVVIAEIPYYFDYGTGRADLNRDWNWDGYEDTNTGVYDNLDDYYANEYSDENWEDFDPDSGSFTEIIPTIENLNKVSTDIAGVILYESLDGNKYYFSDSEGGDIKAIVESSGEAVWQLSHQYNDGFGSRQDLRAVTSTDNGYIVAIQVENNYQNNNNSGWRVYDLDNTGVINWDSEYWGEIIGYESQ